MITINNVTYQEFTSSNGISMIAGIRFNIDLGCIPCKFSEIKYIN